MPDIIISDTSYLIIFDKIGELEILRKVYNSVTITPEIAEEFSGELPSWIKIQSVKDKKYQKFLETQVDGGEASAIALAMEIHSALLLLDDLKARKLAEKLNLMFTGSLGVILKARKLGVLASVKPVIEKILETNFRISEKVIDELLSLDDKL